ncbi:hypothetical protein FOZ62_018415 [Perkinsus olseni]|uniref:CMP/dCMP-type deaminase domain-containing protein n=1 Tax=Perkinsus olseni TaxID=32597 RepID=A0A7J6SPK8_PEROL|nr:hypothetical protein FOZ62_018415 [Perkinsus olseni]
MSEHTDAETDDETFMRMALAEAEMGRMTTPPSSIEGGGARELLRQTKAERLIYGKHCWQLGTVVVFEFPPVASLDDPWVGCVLVQNGKVVGKGHHVRKGGPHAEINALRDMEERGESIEGSKLTAYVTLEPCSHYGSTPPCCEKLIKVGVGRVVVGLEDPDPKVSGRGLQRLRQEGVDVKTGCLADQIRESLRAYLKHRTAGLPLVVGKVAASLNGMVCCEDGSSQWITGSGAREDSHRTLRALSQAILVGVGTVLADDCSLTVRGVEGVEKQPLRVVLDPRGRILRTAKILRTEEAPTLIVVGPGADQTGLEGVEVLEVGVDEDCGLDLTAVLKDLAGRGIFQVLVEGGAKTLTNFIENQLVDELVVSCPASGV